MRLGIDYLRAGWVRRNGLPGLKIDRPVARESASTSYEAAAISCWLVLRVPASMTSCAGPITSPPTIMTDTIKASFAVTHG